MTRGGSRPGAGRKKRLDDRRSVSIVLDAPARRQLAELAADQACSESEAARRAIAQAWALFGGGEPSAPRK